MTIIKTISMASLSLFLSACSSRQVATSPDETTVIKVEERTRIVGEAVTGSDAEPISIAEGENLDWQKLVRLAFQRNPDVQAARAHWQAAVAAYPQAKALPNPMLRYDYYGAEVETRVGPQRERYMVSQAFPFPGTLGTRAHLAELQTHQAYVAYEKALRDCLVELKQTWSEIRYLEQAMRLTASNQEFLKKFAQATSTEKADGDFTLNSHLKLESSAAQAEYDLLLYKDLNEVAWARLAAILDLKRASFKAGLRREEIPLPKLDYKRLESLAETHREELKIADLEVLKTETAVKLSRLKNLPSFSLYGTYIETDPRPNMTMPDNGKDPWMVGIGAQIPLWYSRNKAQTNQAKAVHEKAKAAKKSLLNKTRSDLRKAYFKYRNAQRLTMLYQQTLIPQVKKAMVLIENWEKAGQKDLSRALETQGLWLNFNLAYYRARADQEQALAKLEALTGIALTGEGEK